MNYRSLMNYRSFMNDHTFLSYVENDAKRPKRSAVGENHRAQPVVLGNEAPDATE